MEQLKPTILVVDDDEDIVEMTQLVLESEGYYVVSCTNPLEVDGLKVKPDLVVTDLQMPKMSGISLIRKIRERYNDNKLPGILMTARTPNIPCIQDFISKEGTDRFLPKPFSIDDILHSVERVFKLIN